ncbi:MAG: ABC transporter substrate-binding protein, partial [Flavobacteriales bacterium]
EYQGLLQGRYDFMSGIHPAFKDELLTAEGQLRTEMMDRLHFQKVPFVKTDYLGWYVDEQTGANVQSPWLNPKVRRAVACAVQKEKMIRYLRNNTVYHADQGFIPPALNPLDTSHYNSFSLNNAEQLLREAGYPHGENLPPLVISCTSDYTDLMEFIQHDLKQVGIQVQIQVLQGPALREQSAKGQLSMFRKSWLADYPDAENFLTVFATSSFCPAGPNYTHYSNSRFDSLYRACRVETVTAKRYEQFAEMNAILMRDCPVIPLYYDQVSHFIGHQVHGLQTNPLNMIDLRTVYKTSAHAED